ncbi:MAG: type II secretion system protein GspK [Gemmataceae bacterium]
MRLRAQNRANLERRGVVLLAVLVVLVLLSLAAWQYSDLMVAETQASDNYHKSARVKAIADSGVHYAAALLSNPDNLQNVLGGNPFDNQGAFSHIPVPGDDGKPMGFFTLVAPANDIDENNSAAYRNGVMDETAKINPNAIMRKDPTGQTLFQMLQKLPNMTDDVAAAIVDWIDNDKEPFNNGLGAEDDYYGGLNPPYRAKNAALDSIEEMLLIKGVTEQLLFGDDLNHNGVQDANEPATGSDGRFDRGWSAYLTIHSREQAINSQGQPLVYINDDDLEKVYEQVGGYTDSDDLAKYVLIYRQYGPSSTTGQKQSLGRSIVSLVLPSATKTTGSTSGSSASSQTVNGALSDLQIDIAKPGTTTIKSLFELINTQVTIPSKGKDQPAVIYTCPLNDPGAQQTLLPLLFEAATVFEETEIPGRINVTTASRAVLSSLPELQDGDVQKILDNRPSFTGGGAAGADAQNIAWLLTKAGISAQTLIQLEKLLTARSQVYRVQVLAYLADKDGNPDTKGIAARVEAVIDTNAGRPRILAWRDLSDLGRTIQSVSP